MAKKTNSTRVSKKTISLAGMVAGIVGILVSLSAGAGMATRVLTLEVLLIPQIITVIAGWIVIIGTILSIVMALFGK